MIRNIQGFALMLLGIALILYGPVSKLSILGLLLVFVAFFLPYLTGGILKPSPAPRPSNPQPTFRNFDARGHLSLTTGPRPAIMSLAIEYCLIKSGGGTGPMKPRQPALQGANSGGNAR